MEAQTTKPFTPNELIAHLVKIINAERIDLFYKAISDHADKIPAGGKFHYELKSLLRKKPVRLQSLDSLDKSLKGLLNVSASDEQHIHIPASVQAVVDDLLIEWSSADVFALHNIPVRRKLLLHGPTGNGKTSIARHIAKLIELPFVEVSADMVIDSGLGSTGANIHKIFKNINEPCVLFWDEVDTIGRKRGGGGDSAAGNENDRMVNSILVNMEKMHRDIIFIGATNRLDVLDSAFLRRFDTRLEIDAPDKSQRLAYASSLFSYHNLDIPIDTDINKIIGLCESYAQVKDLIMSIARHHILSGLTETQSPK